MGTGPRRADLSGDIFPLASGNSPEPLGCILPAWGFLPARPHWVPRARVSSGLMLGTLSVPVAAHRERGAAGHSERWPTPLLTWAHSTHRGVVGRHHPPYRVADGRGSRGAGMGVAQNTER